MSESYKAKTHYQQHDVARHYDAERFSSWHGRRVHDNEARLLRDAMHQYFTVPGRILDIPCGTARLLEVYNGSGHQVVGADISQAMLDVAAQRYEGNANVSFELANAEALPFGDGAFDYLVSYRLMCHLPRELRRTVLEQMIRVTTRVLAINYHFEVFTPLMMFNRMLQRKASEIVEPPTEDSLRHELQDLDVEIAQVRKLSWYDRSSALVVLKRKGTSA